jgi:hypothetical protein
MDEHRIFLSLVAAVLHELYRDKVVIVGVTTGGTDALATGTTLQPQVILLGLGKRDVNDLPIPHEFGDSCTCLTHCAFVKATASELGWQSHQSRPA